MDKNTRPLSEREAADRLGLSPRTLQDWRRRSCGPAFLKLGKRVAYRPTDLDEYEAACRVQPKGMQEGA
ncbi:helix-turn-helix transcriptional regulator [Lysobacter sp. GCM10012299]|uniref:helix-turn-helix transcriptional regulator n=1 Tax=Lysobacter sp. GCM10012299 TaxID=3317333 RepID=UPI00361B6CB2